MILLYDKENIIKKAQFKNDPKSAQKIELNK